MSAACDYSYIGQPAGGAPAPAAPAAEGQSASYAPSAGPVVVPVGNVVPARDGGGRRDGDGRRGGDRPDGEEPEAPTEGEQPEAPTEGEQPQAPTEGEQPQAPTEGEQPEAPTEGEQPGTEGEGEGEGETEVNNGLEVLGSNCDNSDLAPHTGFQESPACVQTSMGEIAAEDRLPSLLIVEAPGNVGVGEDFEMQVATRNLVRDRFLGAAAGGYYLESSFLNDDGLQRGHFHTACRILPSTDEAPDSSPEPAFFVATQDNGGGEGSDTVTIQVTGIDTAGQLQCTSWAGDGSHRTPMMTKANQTPAIDSVRITVE